MAGTVRAIPAPDIPVLATSRGWLVDSRFDAMFLVLPAALALGVGLGVTQMSLATTWSMLLFLWLLGQPHLVATFTRAGLDPATRKEFRYHLFVLPMLILACTITVAFSLGPWTIATLYFYWQSWHFMRQSYGVERLYARKAEASASADWVTWGVIYILPLIGLLRRSHQNFNLYLGMEIEWLPVPVFAMHAGTVLLLVLLAAWVSMRMLDYRRGRLRAAHSIYMLSHIAVFGFAFFIVDLPDHGWLVISIWHSLQYMMIVWLFNKKRSVSPEAPASPAFQWFAGPRHWVFYLLFCLAAAALVFQTLPLLQPLFADAGLPQPWLIGLALAMGFNFHHYSLDAVIWKLRKKKVRQNMGVN